MKPTLRKTRAQGAAAFLLPDATSSRRRTKPSLKSPTKTKPDYTHLLSGIGGLLEQVRRNTARAVNALMTATYWHIGRQIVEFEQGGAARAEYGEGLLKQLSADLTAQFGRGFSEQGLAKMRLFYQVFSPELIWQTVAAKIGVLPIFSTLSRKSTVEPISETASKKSADGLAAAIIALDLPTLAQTFPLPWSHYVMLTNRSRSPEALEFYHAEALRGGWSVRQLDRQMSTLFYERAAFSRNKAAVLTKGEAPRPGEQLTPDEEIRDPLVLEFLNLRDEYSESKIEEALIKHLETFLLELGNDFAFVGRQRRLRVGDAWYRIDLLFFHRRLRCLVIIDLKLDKFTHADAGQMHLYLNYAREHWTHEGENPPVGLILCAQKDEAVAKYALDNLPNKILAREYLSELPGEKLLALEMNKTRRLLESRKQTAQED